MLPVRENGIQVRRKRRFEHTVDSMHGGPVARNLQGHYTLELPTKFDRKKRTATMAIRATSATLDMSEPAADDLSRSELVTCRPARVMRALGPTTSNLKETFRTDSDTFAGVGRS